MIVVCKTPAARGETTKPESPHSKIVQPQHFDFNGQRYTIDQILGGGGHGQVYSASSASGDKKAIKLVNGATDILVEAELGMRVNSPNVVRTHALADTDTGVRGIVMDIAQGTNVKNIILNAQKLGDDISADQIRQILLGISIGLFALHEKGIVHRDIKPANAVFNQDGTTQIFDLGIAADLNERSARRFGIGTILYAAHEQIFPGPQNPLSPSADVYSLATTAYEMLFRGDAPFELDTLRSLPLQYQAFKSAVHKMCSDRYAEEVRRLRRFGSFGQLIGEGLHPEPSMRPGLDKFITTLS